MQSIQTMRAAYDFSGAQRQLLIPRHSRSQHTVSSVESFVHAQGNMWAQASLYCFPGIIPTPKNATRQQTSNRISKPSFIASRPSEEQERAQTPVLARFSMRVHVAQKSQVVHRDAFVFPSHLLCSPNVVGCSAHFSEWTCLFNAYSALCPRGIGLHVHLHASCWRSAAKSVV